MDQSSKSELTYLLYSFIILLLFIFFYGLGASLTDLALFISRKQMSNKAMIIFFWLVIMFSINLFRQIKLKFDSPISNQILIGVGLVLIFFFYIFSQNASSQTLTISNGQMIFEKNKYTKAAIFYWVLLVTVAFVVLFSLRKCLKMLSSEIE